MIARIARAVTRTPARRAVAATALVVVVVAAVLVVGWDRDQPVATAGPTTTGSTTTTAAPSRATAPPTTAPPTLPPPPDEGLRFLPEDVPDNGSRAPLTGLPVVDPLRLGRPAVVVKVDNLDTPGETARPQVGLAHADVVVEEVVEGGITRFVAVLHSTDAPEVGPVRSARTTDVDLVPTFGAPLFAYSGGNPGVVAAVRGADRIVDRGGEWAPAYVRVRGRRAPHNLFVRPWEIWATGGGEAPPPLGAFRPEPAPSPVGEPVRGVALGFRGAAAVPVSWTWAPEHRRWLRHQRGTLHVDGEGWTVGPRNVVVLEVDHVASPADPRSPEAVTVGSGGAWVLTDGKLVAATWARPDRTAPLALTGPDGAPVSLAAGRTWIELVPPGATTVVR